MNGSHVQELVDGYLLSALEPDEDARVRAHVAGCAACAWVLVESRDVLAVLPGSLDELSPRPSVRAALLAAAAREVAAGNVDYPDMTERTAGDSRRTPTPAADDRPVRLLPFRIDKRSSNPFLRWASLGIAAAFVIGLVGGVTGWAVVLGDRLNKKDDDLEKSRDNIEKLVKSEHLVQMSSTYRGANVRAVVAVPSSASDALVVVSDVPTATTGNGYHLWLFAQGATQSAGIVMPDSAGDIVATLGVDVAAYDRLELDLQPLDASAPGGEVVIGGALR